MTQMYGRSAAVWVTTIIALLFGASTLKSGGQVLFGGGGYRRTAGDYVLFMVWFNFIAGFFYLVAGFGIWMRYEWSKWLSFAIALATLSMFALFGLYILDGGAYEMRTIGAMSLRSMVWVLITLMLFRELSSGRGPSI